MPLYEELEEYYQEEDLHQKVSLLERNRKALEQFIKFREMKKKEKYLLHPGDHPEQLR